MVAAALFDDGPARIVETFAGVKNASVVATGTTNAAASVALHTM
jgi:hypothetical protein